MTQPSSDILSRIEGLLRAGRLQESRLLLKEYIKSNPASVRAWWLMSQAVDDRNQQMDCLRQILRLDPGNSLARERLEKLKTTASELPASSSAVFTAKPVTPESKTSSGGTPVAPSLAASPAGQPQMAASVPPASAGPVAKVPIPVSGTKKTRGGILDYVMAAFLILIISIAAIYFWSLEKTKAAQAQAESLQETQAVALLFTRLPSLTFSPTQIASLTPAATLTATITRTPTPTLESTPTRTPPSSDQIRPEVGYYPPDFSLVELGSVGKVSLSQFAGKPVLIFFWATWSSDSRSEIILLKTIYQAYKDQGLVILAIDCSESASTVASFQNTNNLPFRILLDQTNSVQVLYLVNSIPKHFFINSSGRIAYIKAGSIDLDQLESQVKAILP